MFGGDGEPEIAAARASRILDERREDFCFEEFARELFGVLRRKGDDGDELGRGLRAGFVPELLDVREQFLAELGSTELKRGDRRGNERKRHGGVSRDGTAFLFNF